jgi:hypothetical protein
MEEIGAAEYHNYFATHFTIPEIRIRIKYGNHADVLYDFQLTYCLTPKIIGLKCIDFITSRHSNSLSWSDSRNMTAVVRFEGDDKPLYSPGTESKFEDTPMVRCSPTPLRQWTNTTPLHAQTSRIYEGRRDTVQVVCFVSPVSIPGLLTSRQTQKRLPMKKTYDWIGFVMVSIAHGNTKTISSIKKSIEPLEHIKIQPDERRVLTVEQVILMTLTDLFESGLITSGKCPFKTTDMFPIVGKDGKLSGRKPPPFFPNSRELLCPLRLYSEKRAMRMYW